MSSGDLEHIRFVLAEFFDSLEREAITKSEIDGPLVGPVKPAQRPWSETLDRIAAEREVDAG